MSFLACEAKRRVKKENHLLKLEKMLDWKRIGRHLNGLYAYEVNGNGGQKPYDSLKMFKAVLLGQWHNLSDAALEEALQLRMDFMLFTGFEDDVPDETTICRFRNLLVDRKVDQKLFPEVNRQLERIGLKVKECRGAVVDATVIESAARPNKVVNSMPKDREEVESEDVPQTAIECSKDGDAKWLKKGKRSYYGYKGFVATDSEDGFIENVHVTPANESEVKNLGNALGKLRPKRVYADKGYASEANRAFLKGRGIKDGIMAKAVRGNALTERDKAVNRLISKVRFIVEQAFGTLKRRFKAGRARYIGLKKVAGELRLKAICFNLLKAVNKVELA